MIGFLFNTVVASGTMAVMVFYRLSSGEDVQNCPAGEAGHTFKHLEVVCVLNGFDRPRATSFSSIDASGEHFT